MANSYDVQSAPSEPKDFKDFFYGLHRHDKYTLVKPHLSTDLASREVHAFPTDQNAQEDEAPIRHIRRKRYMSFRPLFVYRQLAAEAHESEEHKEATKLHSHHHNGESYYE